MPDPITIAIIIAAVLAGTVVLWHHIVNVFASYIIPFLRRHIGDTVADGVASMVAWVDRKVVLARNAVATLWRVFKERILGIKAVYRKTSATKASVETISTIRTGQREVKRERVTEEEVPLDELPDEVREQIIRNPLAPVEVDLKADVERRVISRASEEGIKPQELDMKI
jgi:hypothetical protein